jgi:hypothetical protein
MLSHFGVYKTEHGWHHVLPADEAAERPGLLPIRTGFETRDEAVMDFVRSAGGTGDTPNDQPAGPSDELNRAKDEYRLTLEFVPDADRVRLPRPTP